AGLAGQTPTKPPDGRIRARLWRFNTDMRTRILTILLCVPLLLYVFGCSSNEEKAARFITRGDRLIEKGDPVRAILQYKNALQLDPKSAAAHLALGKALLRQREYLPAYRTLSEALE